MREEICYSRISEEKIELLILVNILCPSNL